MASRSLSDLTPAAREKCMKWVDACKKEAGIDVLVYCTFRPMKEQDALFQVGRTVPGENVTKAKPMGDTVTDARAGDSFHQYRVAWDAVPLANGKPQWGNKEAYKRMGAIAEGLGIEWAGNWKSFKETAHFQFNDGMTLAAFKLTSKQVA